MRGTLAVVALVLGAAAAAATMPRAPVSLTLPEEMTFATATFLIGRFDPGPALLGNITAVGATALDLPAGNLVVCPVERGRRGVLEPVIAANGTCRDGVVHENPRVRFGGKTWVELGANLSVARPPAASLTWLTAPDEIVWAAASSPDGLGIRLDDGVLAFQPTLPSSQVLVEERRDVFAYNGTDFVFGFVGNGTADLRAAGFIAEIRPLVPLTLAPTERDLVPVVLSAAVLLDLQEAARGADRREPVRNATEVVPAPGRAPALVNGAVVGHLDGEIGGRGYAPGAPVVVRIDRLGGAIDDGVLDGDADVRYVVTASGMGLDGDGPVGPPWLAAVLLWITAAVVAFVRRPASPSVWGRVAGAAAPLVAFVAWDLVVRGILGVSAFSLLAEQARLGFDGLLGPGLGPALALVTFEAAALALAWLLLALPARMVAARAVPARFVVLAPVVALVVVLLVTFLWPERLFALGYTVARLT